MEPVHPWMERLSEYLDGELSGAETEALEAHLALCGECRAVLEELHAVVAVAGSLTDRPPERDLWPGIAERIAVETRAGAQAGPQTGPQTETSDASGIDFGERRRRRAIRLTFSLPQLAAAAVALMVLSGASVWFALAGSGDEGGRPVAERTVEPTSAERPSATRFVLDDAVPGYDQAVAELEQALRDGRDRLAPETVEVLEENLAIIDRAIEEARQAVVRDPGNVYLNNHLAESMKRKLQFLRRVGSIVRAQT